jgi:hypothetical protein
MDEIEFYLVTLTAETRLGTARDPLNADVILLAGQGITGTFNARTGTYALTVPPGFTDRVIARRRPQGSAERAEPLPAVKVAGETCVRARPEDGLRVLFDREWGDDYPWRRSPTFGGEEVDLNRYLPPQPDLRLTPLDVTGPTVTGADDGQAYEVSADGADVTGDDDVDRLDLRLTTLSEYDTATRRFIVDPRPTLYAWDASTTRRVMTGTLGDGQVLLADPARTFPTSIRARLRGWWPLVEHRLRPLYAADVSPQGRAATYESDIEPSDRRWDTARGWYLRVDGGRRTVTAADRRIDDKFTVTWWVRGDVHDATPRTIFSVGPISLALSVGAPRTLSVQCATTLSTVITPVAITLPDGWHAAHVTVDGDMIELGVGLYGAAPTLTFGVAPNLRTWRVDDVVTFGGGDALVTADLQDVRLFDGVLDALTLARLRAPILVPLPAEFHVREFYDRVRSQRLTLARTPESVFVFPVRRPGEFGSARPGQALRHMADGRYVGPARSQTAGLGPGRAPAPLGVRPLGEQGDQPDGLGRALATADVGSRGGVTATWLNVAAGSILNVAAPYGVNGGVVTTVLYPPASPWPPVAARANAALRALVLLGDDGLTYVVTAVTDTLGPTLRAARYARARPQPEFDLLPASKRYPDAPTDARSRVRSATAELRVRLDVAGQPEVYASGGTFTPTAPTTLYVETQDVLSVTGAPLYARWLDPTTYGATRAIVAREDAGAITLVHAEPLPAGQYELTFDVGNDGDVDASFDGFNVELNVNEAVTTVARLLTQFTTRRSPTGRSVVALNLATAIAAPWTLMLTWTNPREVPARVQRRRLRIDALRVGLVRAVAHDISLTPSGYTLTPRTPGNTFDLTLAGGWETRRDATGVASAATHESDIYGRVPDNPANDMTRSAAVLFTASTNRRNDDLELVTTHVRPDEPAVVGPAVTSLDVTLIGPYVAGQLITLTATGAVGVGPLRYVWTLPDDVRTTDVPTLNHVIQPIDPYPLRVDVVDDRGTSVTALTTLAVARPPVITDISISANDAVAPYVTTLVATAIDPTGGSPAFTWLLGVTVVGTAATLNYNVTGTLTLTLQVTNVAGNARADVQLRAVGAGAPSILGVDFDPQPRVGAGLTTRLAVSYVDPGAPTTVSWSTWRGETLSGTTTRAGAVLTNEVTLTLTGETANVRPVAVTVTDTSTGRASVRTINLALTVNRIPQILRVDAPLSVTSDRVTLAAVAIDPDGDPLTYVWRLSNPARVLYGPRVDVFTASLPPGTVLAGQLEVTDGYGGTDVRALPAITLT